MNIRHSIAVLSTILVISLAVVPVYAARVKDKDTIKSLESKDVDIRPGKIILGSSNLARENYRAFLDLVSDDPELRAEAMRRLGDLELEATEAQQLVENIDALDYAGFKNVVGLYQRLLEAYPDYRRNDTVLYQLARAYEIGGRTDEALEVLDVLFDALLDHVLESALRGSFCITERRLAVEADLIQSKELPQHRWVLVQGFIDQPLAVLDPAGELDLSAAVQQRHRTHFTEIHSHRIADLVVVARLEFGCAFLLVEVTLSAVEGVAALVACRALYDLEPDLVERMEDLVQTFG